MEVWGLCNLKPERKKFRDYSEKFRDLICDAFHGLCEECDCQPHMCGSICMKMS